jgi:hypothetical protein
LLNTGKTNLKRNPAAQSYLSLLVGATAAAKLVKAFRKHEGLTHFAAKDILRASGLPLLGPEDSEVASDLEKVKFGKQLSPVLLIQGSPLWVADGYHRVCASYYLNERLNFLAALSLAANNRLRSDFNKVVLTSCRASSITPRKLLEMQLAP